MEASRGGYDPGRTSDEARAVALASAKVRRVVALRGREERLLVLHPKTGPKVIVFTFIRLPGQGCDSGAVFLFLMLILINSMVFRVVLRYDKGAAVGTARRLGAGILVAAGLAVARLLPM